MKISHSMCGPYEDTDIIFGPVRHFGWHSCSTPSYHKHILLVSLSHSLSQHSVARTKNFLSRACPAPGSTRTRSAPTRITLRVPAPAPQMWVPQPARVNPPHAGI